MRLKSRRLKLKSQNSINKKAVVIVVIAIVVSSKGSFPW